MIDDKKNSLEIENELNKIFDLEKNLLNNNSLMKTGFNELDLKLGGLYSGLYILGATSGLGKTTFIHQLAEQLIENDTSNLFGDVLYFSLEQSKIELISKTFSRIINVNNDNNLKFPVTSLDLRKGLFEKERLNANNIYIQKNYKRLKIIDVKHSNVTLSFLKEYVDKHIKNSKIKPVIIIDYLQILENDLSNRNNSRDLIDNCIIELKKLSLKHSIIIIAISSLNRLNYLSPIDFESFKESGNIEYTADVVLGLQLKILNDFEFNKNSNIITKRNLLLKAKADIPRKLELVCLKNRFGISNYSTDFNYYPNIDFFEEIIIDKNQNINLNKIPKV